MAEVVRHTRYGSRRRDAAGFTLVELIVVIGILATVMALSVTVYQKISTTNALPAATSRVSTIIRAARNFSVAEGLPSRVFIEPGDAHRITAFGYRLVAAWHFEDAGAYSGSPDPIPDRTNLMGAYKERAQAHGDVYAGRGKVGTGLYFSPQSVGAAVVADPRPRYYSPTGFSIEAWVRFQQPPLTEAMLKSRRQRKGAWRDPRREDHYAIISKRGSYEMGLLGDGALYVQLGTEGTEQEFVVETDGAAIVANRWSHVRATFDGIDFTLEIDGMMRDWFPRNYGDIDVRDWPPFPTRVPEADGDLTISRQDRIFFGDIDEPKIRVALEPRSYELPPELRFFGLKRPMTIYFDTRGSLDPLHHRRPIVLRITDSREIEADAPQPGLTAVVLAAGTGEEPKVDEAEEEPEIGDPLQALAQYLAENQDAAEGIDTEGLPEPIGQDQQDDGNPKDGRTSVIVIDLTGTIRG